MISGGHWSAALALPCPEGASHRKPGTASAYQARDVLSCGLNGFVMRLAAACEPCVLGVG